MHFIDTHAHLTDLDAYDNLDEIIKRAKDANVLKIINICTNKASLEKGLRLAEKYDCIYNTAATTPHDVEKEGDIFFPIVDQIAENKQIVAIGETGLDYYYKYSPLETQKKFLQKYIKLAKKYNLPLVIHCRESFSDLFKIADTEGLKSKAVLHCFTGTQIEAKEVLKRGWYISFSGIVTFKNSNELREVIEIVPLDRILIETDSPYLAPQVKRGKKNEPANVVEIAKTIAGVKNMNLDEVANITYKNAINFFLI